MKKVLLSLILCLGLFFSIPGFAAADCSTSPNFSFSTDFNKFVITNNDSKAPLKWGDYDRNDCVINKGQKLSHDYEYDPNGWKSYNIALGGKIIGTITIYGDKKTSVFIPVVSQQTPNPGFSIPVNQWAIGNIIVLPLYTEIHEYAGINYQITDLVVNSFWLVKITNGPNYVDDYTWWKIELANGRTGWVKQADPIPPLFK